MRFAVNRLANQLSLTGFVANLYDGRVHIVAEGEPKTIDEFLESIQSYGPGVIQRLEGHYGPATGEFANFTVKA